MRVDISGTYMPSITYPNAIVFSQGHNTVTAQYSSVPSGSSVKIESASGVSSSRAISGSGTAVFYISDSLSYELYKAGSGSTSFTLSLLDSDSETLESFEFDIDQIIEGVGELEWGQYISSLGEYYPQGNVIVYTGEGEDVMIGVPQTPTTVDFTIPIRVITEDDSGYILTESGNYII